MARLAAALGWWALLALLALAVVVAAAMGFLAWRTPHVRMPALQVEHLENPPVATPELPPLLGPAREAKLIRDAAFARSPAMAARPGAVRVRCAGGSGRLVVAALDAHTDAVSARTETAEPEAVLQRVPPGPTWIVAAASDAQLRYGYVARIRVEVVAGEEAVVDLPCTRADLRVLVPKDAGGHELSVLRDDDPRWLLPPPNDAAPSAAASRRLVQAAYETIVLRDLPAARYRLSARGKAAVVDVPHSTSVDLR